ncbi:MAG TPA: hypothetical protein VGM69_08000 [Chloroflexota bacterium]|jgi:hypothetical protein
MVDITSPNGGQTALFGGGTTTARRGLDGTAPNGASPASPSGDRAPASSAFGGDRTDAGGLAVPLPENTGGSRVAAFIATAPLAPVAAAVASVAAYAPAVAVLPPDLLPAGLVGAVGYLEFARELTLVGATVNYALCWMVLAGLYIALGFTSGRGANAGAYDELRRRAAELRAHRRALPPEAAVRAKWAAFCTHADAVADRLGKPGSQWVLGSGYIDLWDQVHRAEEEWLALASPDWARCCMRHDLQRARSSQLEATDLVAGAEAALGNGPAAPASGAGRGNAPAAGAGVDGRAARSANDLRRQARQLRRAVNEYRDNRRAALVRTRNYLAAAMLFTGVTVYTLLWLAIGARTPVDTVQAGMTVFLIGAIVGLFNRLYSDARVDGVQDDYGLTVSRLLMTPLLSGVAAVLGVALISTAAAVQAAPGAGAGPLRTAFDLLNQPISVLTAAALGLTPGVLLDQLNQRTARLKDDLQASQASGAHRAAAARSGQA